MKESQQTRPLAFQLALGPAILQFTKERAQDDILCTLVKYFHTLEHAMRRLEMRLLNL